METIGEILGGIAAVVTAGVAACKAMPAIRNLRKKRTIVHDLKKLHAVYSAMERLQGIGATRVVVFAGHNCGGKPGVGRNFFVSALHWSLATGKTDRISDYSNISVDAEYIRMLIRLSHDGLFHFDPETAPDCLLRDYYHAEGVSDSYLFFLGIVDRSFLFLSACRHNGRFSPDEVVGMTLAAHAIKEHTR